MSFWKSGINRAKTGEKRLENTTPFERYLKDIEWVDLGNPDVMYALNDFPLNENLDLLSINDIREIKDSLPEGFAIMTKSNVKWLKDNCEVGLTKFGSRMIGCMSKLNGYQIFFNIYESEEKQNALYFIKYLENENRIMMTEVGPNKFPSYLGTVIEVPNYTYNFDEKKYTIKLVKEKW